MGAHVDLGTELEKVVKDLLDRGVYASRADVLRAGVALVVAREARLAEMDAAIDAGIADAEAGRTVDAEELFDALII